MQTIELPPYLPALMESARAIGYSPEAAAADIIDNSIAAGAKNVDISFFSDWDACISVPDDGWQ